MKFHKSFAVILLAGLLLSFFALNIVGCGGNQHEKENYFSFDEANLKPIYQATDKVDLALLNSNNKAIDSVAYFVNVKRASSTKGNNKFILDLNGKKLG